MAPARYQGQVVFCHDVERTARLFVEVLGFQRTADDGSGDISLRAQVADSPSATVEIYLHPSPGPAAHHLGTFQVDDVDAVTAPPSNPGMSELGVTRAVSNAIGACCDDAEYGSGRQEKQVAAAGTVPHTCHTP
jgi:hypothetical protein